MCFVCVFFSFVILGVRCFKLPGLLPKQLTLRRVCNVYRLRQLKSSPKALASVKLSLITYFPSNMELPSEPCSVEQLSALLERLDPVGAPSFPTGWKTTPAGLVLQEVFSSRGWWSIAALPAAYKGKVRVLYSLLASGKVEYNAFKKTSESEMRALLGDALHGFHLRSVCISRDLDGPEKQAFLVHYASAEHQAQYICALEGTPVPTTKLGLHHASTEFESRYLNPQFAVAYLRSVFVGDEAKMALGSVFEVTRDAWAAFGAGESSPL